MIRAAPDAVVTRRGRRWSLTTRRQVWGAVFVAPAMAFLLFFHIYPTLQAFYLSLTSYDLLTPPEFTGLDNYQALLTDDRFQIALQNTFGYAFGRTVPVVVLALLVALVLSRQFRGVGVYRTLFYTPVVLSGVVVAIVWGLLYQAEGGLINQMIAPFTGGQSVFWLTKSYSAPWAIIIMAVWQSLGFYMVIFIAGLQAIAQDYYEAASIDGANALRRFWHITVPLLKPTTLFVSVIAVIGGFQAFTYQFVMTRGGPSDATNVASLLIYDTGLQFMKMGLAAAMSIVLFAIIMVFTLIQLRIGRTTD
jgi:ABC-type sugar transport system permease subunit